MPAGFSCSGRGYEAPARCHCPLLQPNHRAKRLYQLTAKSLREVACRFNLLVYALAKTKASSAWGRPRNLVHYQQWPRSLVHYQQWPRNLVHYGEGLVTSSTTGKGS